MKRQSIASKSGFTLFELMIVIAIFGLFIGATSMFTYSPQTEMEKSDRLINLVSSTLKASLQNISIGRMPNRDGVISTEIRINTSTAGIQVQYFTGSMATNAIRTENYAPPFFDGDSDYAIQSVIWTGSSTNPSYTGPGQIIINTQGVTFSGAGIAGSGYTVVEIQAGYLTRSRKVTLDRRTGKITESKR